jgi:hypothetical protein
VGPGAIANVSFAPEGAGLGEGNNPIVITTTIASPAAAVPTARRALVFCAITH